jgi:glycerol-3-phosphate acyltransferase PlsY
MTLYLIVAAIAYLLGSIPFGYILVKVFRGQDIRLSGSGNIGATNVVRSGAKGLGIATLLLDVLKGVAAVWIAGELAQSRMNPCIAMNGADCQTIVFKSTAALFAVLGHIFPVWLKFKGGKGVATALGVFALLFPKAVLVCLAVFIVVLVVSRYVSLGSILAAATFPVASWFLYYPTVSPLIHTGIASAVVIAKHHQNIRRLLKGNENRLWGSKSSKSSAAEKQA